MKMSDNPAKHEVLIKQYLRSILDIGAKMVNIVNLPLASTRCSPSSNGSGSTPVK